MHQTKARPGGLENVPEQFEERIWPVDPLLCRFDMPLRASFYPLGFPVEIETNSEHVLQAAQENWGAFRQMFSERPMQIRIGVLDGNKEPGLVEPVLRSQRHLLVKVGGREDFAVCDFERGFAFAWVSTATAENHPYLHTHYIEGTAFWLLHVQHLAPIHAACVALNGKGILFCGDSEAGKSSLSYACARRGWTFITDDLTELVRAWDTTTVLGNPHRIRLRESALNLFPELRGHPVTLRANGERAIEIATAKDKSLVTAPCAPVDYVLFLRRKRSGPAVLCPFSRERALRWFEQVLCFGEEDVREAQARTLRRLLSAEVLEFQYSDFNSAIDELNALVAVVARPVTVRELPLGYQAHGSPIHQE